MVAYHLHRKGDTMKVSELFNITIALMNESKDNSTPYKEFTIGMVNNLLMDLFDMENAIRKHNKKELLESVPFVTSEDDEIQYDTELCYNVLPWGMGRQYFLGDDEYSKATFWDSQYAVNKDKYNKANYVDVVSYY